MRSGPLCCQFSISIVLVHRVSAWVTDSSWGTSTRSGPTTITDGPPYPPTKTPMTFDLG